MEERIISLTKDEGAVLDQQNREKLERLKNLYFVSVTVYDKRRKRFYGLSQRSMGFPNKSDSLKWARKVPNRACNKIILKHRDKVEYYDLAA